VSGDSAAEAGLSKDVAVGLGDVVGVGAGGIARDGVSVAVDVAFSGFVHAQSNNSPAIIATTAFVFIFARPVLRNPSALLRRMVGLC
jgi:hypothetical protein